MDHRDDAPHCKLVENNPYFRRQKFGSELEIEQGANVAVKVINRKTAPASFLKKFLPRELKVARILGQDLYGAIYRFKGSRQRVHIESLFRNYYVT